MYIFFIFTFILFFIFYFLHSINKYLLINKYIYSILFFKNFKDKKRKYFNDHFSEQYQKIIILI